MTRKLLFFFLSLLWVLTCYAKVHHPQVFLDQVSGRPDEGVQIVQHYCASCHADNPLISVGAPRMLYSSDWLPRLKQGLEQLFQHTVEGLRMMPPRGGCFECSDEQLHLAIRAMLPSVEGEINGKLIPQKNTNKSKK